jgi:signal transduction histidine kinase
MPKLAGTTTDPPAADPTRWVPALALVLGAGGAVALWGLPPAAGAGAALLSAGAVAGLVRLRRLAQGQDRARDAGERLQRQVRDAAGEWQQTFDAIETPILITSAEGTVRRLNRSALDLVGAPGYRDCLGRPIGELGAGALWSECGILVEAVASHGRPLGVVVEDGGRSWDLGASLVEADEGPARIAKLIVVAKEVTNVVRLQESLRSSEMMSALGSLVAGVAHEARNPLFGISAALDCWEVAQVPDAETAELLQILRQQLARLGTLMQDLLDYGKPRARSLVPTSLSAVATDSVAACRPLAESRQVSLHCHLPPDLPPVPADAGRLVTAFKNLVENAIQHSPTGSGVRIALEAVASGEAPTLRLLVEDRGPGFKAEDLPRVFEPFFTRRSGGTGLGLSIVDRVVAEHGGRVSAGNRAGGGATLSVELPCAASAPEITPAAAGRAPGTDAG